jgi:CBS domain-containing protein
MEIKKVVKDEYNKKIDFGDIFKSIKISAVLAYKSRLPDFSKKLISVHEHDSVGRALDIMRNQNIQAVPVYQNKEFGREYIGIVGIYQILAWTIFQHIFDTLSDGFGSTEETFNKFVEESTQLFHTPVCDIIQKQASQACTLHSSQGFLDLLKSLTLLDNKRVLVVNDDVDIQDAVCDREQVNCTKCCAVIVTRADVVRYLFDEYHTKKNVQFCELFESFLETPAMHVSLTHHKMKQHEAFIVTDTTEVTALEAFR